MNGKNKPMYPLAAAVLLVLLAVVLEFAK